MHEKLTDLLDNATYTGDGTSETRAQQSSPNGDAQNSATTEAINQATQAINQLQAATQASTDTLTANTDALTQSSQSHGSSAVANVTSDIGSGLMGGSSLGGGLLGGGLDLLFDGIKSLFGGGTSEPPPLTTYVPPASQDFELATSNGNTGDAVYDSEGQPRETDFTQIPIGGISPGPVSNNLGNGSRQGSGQGSGTSGQQITVQVQAMDSQSFMDRSGDIANAVRQAMLNMHSINDVVNDL